MQTILTFVLEDYVNHEKLLSESSWKLKIGTSGIKYRNLTLGHLYHASIFCGTSAVYPLFSP